MAVTQIRRNTQIKAGSAHRVVVNDAAGLLTDAAAITAARALISDANGIPTHSAVTDTELGYVSGVTSAIQTQLDDKAHETLNNLTTTAINTSLVSDTNNTDDLGSDAIEWKDAWVHSIKHNDSGIPNLVISTTGNNGNVVLSPHGTGVIDASTKKITNVADPVAGTDAANKDYVDSVAAGLDPKASVRASTTAALPAVTYDNGTGGVGATLTADANGALPAQDGITLSVGQRLLVKNQAATLQNGIYTVTVVGDGSNEFVLTRATDQDGSPANEVSGGNFTFVEQGTVNAGTGWVVVGDGNLTVGTDNIVWTQFSDTGLFQFNDTNSIDMVTTGLVITANLKLDGATLSITGSGVKVSDGGITNTQVNAAAAIDFSKLAALTSGNILVGNGSNVATSVSVSGDVTLSNAGVVSITSAALSGSGHFVTRETPSGTINGSNLVFTVANTPISGTEHVFKNGILQNAGSGNDYQISGVTITFETGNAPQTGDVLLVSYHK